MKCYTESFYIDIILKQNKIVEHIHNISTVACEKSKIVSFASLTMKNIAVFAFQSRFAVKLIRCMAFRSAPSACFLLKSIAIILQDLLE